MVIGCTSLTVAANTEINLKLYKEKHMSRPQLYNEETIIKSFRMPTSKELEICKKFETILKKYQIKKKVKK